MKFIKRHISDKRSIKKMIAEIKHRLAFGNLAPEAKTKEEAHKARLNEGGLWT